MRMPRLPKPPTLAETLRLHHDAISTLIGSGAAEVEINAALIAAEGAGLDRTALRMAVREGRIADRERRAEVAARLDYYRAMLDRPEPPRRSRRRRRRAAWSGRGAAGSG